ncbi:rhamnogalacturonan acetylesterase [Novosphingobium sp. 9]|uniref:rhamnogalacturonan acetylesterase n=1 Tax=Novosphingobium sp. 9 TaxID=2025349 RepID=UPI00391EF5C4
MAQAKAAAASVAAPAARTYPIGDPARLAAYTPGGSGIEAIDSAQGFVWSVAVPEGLYRVTVTLGDSRRAAHTTVKAESRRLMLRDVATRAGQSVTRSFLVDVRRPDLPTDPHGAPSLADHVLLDADDIASRDWDDRLSLEFLGAPAVYSIRIEPARTPVIYLVGDSTVADQYAEPYASWGQALPALFDDGVAVSNHAKSGGTMKSLLAQLRLAKVLSRIQPGDWLFIQFGHNDQKQNWPLTYLDPKTTYPAYLRAYIAEARARGANPVLVTSPERRNFDAAGHITDTLGTYAEAVRQVAAQEHVPLIDLNADSRAIYEALGPDVSPRAFAMDGADRTHNDNYGALLLASAVAERIRESIPALAAHITAPPFDPAHPPPPETLKTLESLGHATEKPKGN